MITGVAFSVLPNPFSGDGRILFNNPSTAYANLAIYDCNGRLIATYFSSVLAPGSYSLKVNSNLKTGLYIIRLTINSGATSKKVIVLH